MEAATQKKKSAGMKGKLKKTIKNVLCRPDPVLWPVVSEQNEKNLRAVLENYKVVIPVFTKPHWKELKQIPKEERPKPPKVPIREGLIFGVAQCYEAVKNKDCSAIVLESEVNPRLIVQPIIEACTSADIPIVCLKNLRTSSLSNFGIKTICLGVRKKYLDELTNRIRELASLKPIQRKNDFHEMDVETEAKIQVAEKKDNSTKVANLLLLRKNKKTRVFVPPCDNPATEVKKQFIGQDFIEFPDITTKLKQDNVAFKKMMLKRIMNNPNRMKAGKKRKTENTKL